MKSNLKAHLQLLFVILHHVCLQTSDALESAATIKYLKKFGYISEATPGPGDIPQNSPGLGNTPGKIPGRPKNGSSESVSKAVKTFQEFAGLKATGEVDEETLKLMSLPRCGVRDLVARLPGNVSRYQAQGSVWEKRTLSYRVTRYSRKMSATLVNADVRKAFKYWSDVTNLKFFSKEKGDVDIEIGFFTFNHGDGDPFDGVGGTLAHAFFPIYGGDVHFDADEQWTVRSWRGTSLLQTAAHEFGHSLGLSHSDQPAALMAPFYRGDQGRVALDQDDITAVQALYGEKKEAAGM